MLKSNIKCVKYTNVIKIVLSSSHISPHIIIEFNDNNNDDKYKYVTPTCLKKKTYIHTKGNTYSVV